MKQFKTYIIEKILISNNTKIYKYKYKPKDMYELRKILKERLNKDQNANLNDIDVSRIKDMAGLFYQLNPHNIKIDEWDVSNVTDMESMFYYCDNFNCDLSNWDVSNVENMEQMFAGCSSFKGYGLTNWKPINVKNIDYMFTDCYKLDVYIDDWNIPNTVSMTKAFSNCKTMQRNKLIPDWYKK